MYGYTIHIDFFAYSCSLSVTQVSLFNPSGTLVGSVSSPYGAEVAVTIQTPDPMFTLTASASGLATYGSYYSWPVTGTATLTLGTAGNYWITIRMN